MSTEARPRRSLEQYVRELVERLGGAEPAGLERMREIVGNRRARIRLDDETVDVQFGPEGLQVGARAADAQIDGEGGTDRATVLDLLDGCLEVTDAILDGRILVVGDADNVVRILQAIEILLDGSVRIPSLQTLARDFHDDPGRARPDQSPLRVRRRQTVWYPADSFADETRLLERLDLLPES